MRARHAGGQLEHHRHHLRPDVVHVVEHEHHGLARVGEQIEDVVDVGCRREI